MADGVVRFCVSKVHLCGCIIHLVNGVFSNANPCAAHMPSATKGHCARCGAFGDIAHSLECVRTVVAEYERRSRPSPTTAPGSRQYAGCAECGVEAGMLHEPDCPKLRGTVAERERAIFDSWLANHADTPKATDSVQHTATMTGPYMFPSITPTTKTTQQQKAEELKDAEDKVLAAIEHWPKWVRAICYRQLHALGLRMTDVDELIRKRTA